MKVFFKFLISLLSLPFLIPWFLADKTFEYFFQPFIFKGHKLEVSRRKKWTIRILKALPPILLGLYLVKRTSDFFGITQSFIAGVKNLNILVILFYNDFAKTVNFLLTPLNHLIYYLGGGYIRFWDFIVSFYFCLIPVLFIVNLIYRSIKTYTSINKAVSLRNKAVRDVNIVRFAEAARNDEVFLGLDLNRGGDPFFVRRSWLKGHVQVIGGPGSGKTESIIEPIWFQEMRRNVATFVLDGKASRRNVDRFYTIASSLAQAQDIYYFNPADPERSATYNPLLRGSVSEVKQKIMGSINWAEYSPTSRERLDAVMNIFLRAMEETKTYFNLRELLEYFQSRGFVGKQSERVNDFYVKNGLKEILMDYSTFQSNMSFFIGILRDLFQSGYGQLLVTDKPQIDIVDIYHGHKDCYFTLPMRHDENTARFLGQLILQDIRHCFHQIAMSGGDTTPEEGLLIIDEMAKFVSPHFISVLEASRNIGVSVCYTNQSLAELDNPALNLTKVFNDQLTEHTNLVCCFQLGSPESIQTMINRFGKAGTTGEEDKKGFNITDPDFLKHLDVGRCVLFIRRPRYLTVLKTGYFKFDQLIRFGGQKEGIQGN
ncbi:MAG: type IV secretory system conjugative DNA transfer family protein [bacterium]|nr:MAG: type IV secretory system conjugative DNA transfer family protein [bacterium]